MSVAFVENATLKSTGRRKARQLFVEYRTAVAREPHNHEYNELMNLYHQQAMGRTVMSLNNAMRYAGSNSNGQPMLAIAKADAKWCYFVPDAGRVHDRDGEWNHSSVAFVSSHHVNPGSRKRCVSDRTNSFRFIRALFPIVPNKEIRAQVPIVPPRYRPKTALSNYCILWEANWEQAPVDPYLLRRITKDLFVVMAQWDLTDTERAVMQASIVS